ncbi:THUMP-like domain-containing protein [Flavicella sediminum]|uniref:THUMP-like domain-containing protein n=1 Tax=Flavicella sediminum TaxID=2585141 RepID=UPI00111D2330|nr:class I SAM-dependent methyltransferase [Flavicella sediminum]
MNKNILNQEVQDFIEQNLNENLTKLILKGSPFETVSTQELAQQIEGKNKCAKKLPLWFGTQNIVYPPKLNLEQTSSELTANYKAALVCGNSLLDATGGFGIDSFYFSKKIKEVTHCELNEELSELVVHNQQQFGIENIKNHVGDSLDYIKKLQQKFDWIYIDPSRRNDTKGKVFLLEDCLPNVPDNIDFLFAHSDQLLIKNSPILDITSTINELTYVKEIHVIAVQNEVKELLFLLEKEYAGEIHIKTVNLQKTENQYFSTQYKNEEVASYALPKKYVYEPNAAIMKAGAFQEISAQLQLDKLQQHSHLYTSSEIVKNFPGRTFKINQVVPFDKKKLAKLIPDKKANITTRNFPETVAQIRKKTKIKDGGNLYLFFTTNLENQKIVLFCEKA